MTEFATPVLGQPLVSPVLVGRSAQLDGLRRMVESTAERRGGLALIAGEAGVGKSRLVGEIKAGAADRGIAVLEAACFPQDRACPYAPLLELLRGRFAGLSPDEVGAEVGPYLHDLAPLVPDLMPRVGEVPPPALDPEHERRRLFAAMGHALACQDPGRPTLLVVEDLHWCDDASLEFLHYLARRTPTQPLLIVGTYRGEDAESRLRDWAAQLNRERLGQQLMLVPLSRDEVGEMLGAIFGSDAPAQAELADTVYALSEGNPFFVEELLRSMVEAGVVAQVDGLWRWGSRPIEEWQIPRSLQDVVQQRLDRLGPPARALLTLAAVIGRHFDFGMLQRVAHVDEPTLLALVKELIAAQLVAEESQERFAFRHALIRRVTYTELLARERVALHRTVAEAAEQLYGDAQDRRLDDLAHHFYRAESWEKAFTYARRAGERAQRLYAPYAALEQFSRALQAAEHIVQRSAFNVQRGENQALNVLPDLIALRRARGRAFDTVGDFDSARADYEAIIGLSRDAADPRGELVGLLDLGALWTGRDYQQAGEHLRRALDLARGLAEPELLGQSLNRLGNWQANAAEPRDALPLHEEALAIFEQLGDRHGIAATLDLLGMASYLSGDLDRSMTYFDRAAALFRELDDRVGLVSTLAMLSARAGNYELGTMGSDAADFEMAFRAGEEAAQIAREIGLRGGEAFAVLQLAVALGLRGEYARALRASERGLRIAEEIEHGEWMADAHCAYGQIYLDLLILSKARTHLKRSLELAREVRSDFWIRLATACLAWTTIAEGDFGRTVALLGPLPPGDAPVRSLAERWMVFGHAHLALARRQPEFALRLAGRLNAPPLDGSGPRETPRPGLIRAEALIALGRLDEAEAVLDTVREVVERQQSRPHIWRTHLLRGNLYRAQQRAEDAQREFSAARAQIEDIAAGLPDDDLRDEFLQGATARLPRPYRLSQRRAESARFGGLTAREREVTAMVARGLSNREIADALVLGERTIETHVSNVLAKLGLASRREIARWAVDHGLAT